MTPLVRRRLLGVLVVLTLVVVALDLSGSSLPGRVTAAAAVAAGPVQRAVAGADHGEAARLREENAALRTELGLSQARLAEAGATGRLLAAPSTTGARPLAARVVAFKTTPTGGRTVTIDVGQRDGVEPNLTVVAAGGLVGRVVSVALWSSDVRVLGGSDAVVGVRVGSSGLLGTVGATAPADAPSRERGELSLTLVDPGGVSVGDQVTTLGSVQERPYVPGIVVGAVTSVDPPRGQLTGTAVVRPAVDMARLDVLAVLLAGPRDQPRAGAGS